MDPRNLQVQPIFLLRVLIIVSVAICGSTSQAWGHDLSSEDGHPHYDWSVHPPEQILLHKGDAPEVLEVAQANRQTRQPPTGGPFQMPAIAKPFSMFSNVKLRWDSRFLYVESNGLPGHNMMVGITNWQQQVPLPQPYYGDNAWAIPLHPAPSASPVSIRGHFLRGAIALAANGIPIFNPQNNRGEISQEIGELDKWGGHCGRADDYHYHAAPLHLQAIVGKDQPIAYALDGYAIYGLTEPDGTQPSGLDSFDGHSTPALGYHYHASTKYPYVNGGFHGQVTEREGQVDPQPRAQSVRPDQPPLPGATITAFKSSNAGKSFALQYNVSGRPASIDYRQLSDGNWKFDYVTADGGMSESVYRAGSTARGAPPRSDSPRPPRRGDSAGADSWRRPPPREDSPGTDSERRPPRPGDSGGADSWRRPRDQEDSAGGDSEPRPPRREDSPGADSEPRPPRREDSSSGDSEPRPPRREDSAGAHSEPRAPRREDTAGAGSDPRARNGGSLTRQENLPLVPKSSFVLRSKAVKEMGELPKLYTGDGQGISPPLEWVGAPASTKAFALTMHHIDREGQTKSYWTLYNIPAAQHALPENAHGLGIAGTNSVNPNLGYAPPHSKGPGAKTYIITLYALSAPLQLSAPPKAVTFETLLSAMRGKVLATTQLHIVATRDANSLEQGR